MKTQERKEWIIRRRKAHHAALASLVDGKIDGLTLWRKLHKIEWRMRRANERYCNGEIDIKAWEQEKFSTKMEMEMAFRQKIPRGVFINGDPRGCALKLDPELAVIPEGMERDWGGNGILAAEINED